MSAYVIQRYRINPTVQYKIYSIRKFCQVQSWLNHGNNQTKHVIQFWLQGEIRFILSFGFENEVEAWKSRRKHIKIHWHRKDFHVKFRMIFYSIRILKPQMTILSKDQNQYPCFPQVCIQLCTYNSNQLLPLLETLSLVSQPAVVNRFPIHSITDTSSCLTNQVSQFPPMAPFLLSPLPTMTCPTLHTTGTPYCAKMYLLTEDPC